MTRERAKELAPIIAAYGEGKEIESRIGNNRNWIMMTDPDFNGQLLEYRIKPEPARRLMTRNEVLGFVANHHNIVVRQDNNDWMPAHGWMYNEDRISYCEWATITERGEIGEPHKFEVEDD